MASEVTEPVSDEEIAALSEEIQEQRVKVREYLADELGGAPEDYDASKFLSDRAQEPVADGGE